MWNSETNFDYLNVVSCKKKSLLHRACSKFTIPSKGVALLLDKFNYLKYPKDSIWRKLGNHLNIKLGDGINGKSPQTIKAIICLEKYSHLIWLSKRAWNDTAIEFVWTLSHELRHLEQDIKCRNLSLVGYWLYNNLKGLDIEPKIANTVPTELDAELTAWRVTGEVVCKLAAKEYVIKNAESGKKRDDFLALSKHNPDEPYDIFQEIRLFIHNHQQKLDDLFNVAPEPYLLAYLSFIRQP